MLHWVVNTNHVMATTVFVGDKIEGLIAQLWFRKNVLQSQHRAEEEKQLFSLCQIGSKYNFIGSASTIIPILHEKSWLWLFPNLEHSKSNLVFGIVSNGQIIWMLIHIGSKCLAILSGSTLLDVHAFQDIQFISWSSWMEVNMMIQYRCNQLFLIHKIYWCVSMNY